MSGRATSNRTPLKMEKRTIRPSNEPSGAQSFVLGGAGYGSFIRRKIPVSVRSPTDNFAWRRGRLLLLIRGNPAPKGVWTTVPTSLVPAPLFGGVGQGYFS